MHEKPIARATVGKSFWHLLVDNGSIQSHPALLKFAKNELFKEIACGYLRTNAVLSGVTLMKSFPTDKSFNHSQLWHLDADDDRNIIFYLYISNVSRANGQLSFSKNSQKKFLPPRFLRKHTHSDESVKKFHKRFNPVSITGPSGTMFACDSCLLTTEEADALPYLG